MTTNDSAPPPDALSLIAAELGGGLGEEVWAAAGHAERDSKLARAAAVYATPAAYRTNMIPRQDGDTALWPFARARFEHVLYTQGLEGRIRELVRAGALIVAEIERLQEELRERAQAAPPQ